MNNYTTKWLSFGKFDLPKRKTQIWQVVSVRGVFLGNIRWFPRWRCYAFFPEEETVFNSECLRDIETHLKGLMDERKMRRNDETK